MMSFSDFPMDPSRYPYFTSHKQVLQYLREYADFYDLWTHIEFSTEVVAVEKQDDGKWKAQMKRKDGSNPTFEVFDAVFVCSGRHSKPYIPDFKDRDRYQGLFLHSNLYRAPESFAGKTVAIIGLGNTGIACSP
jgi:dimethylaniline monooxygenase (N-oxide forming)